MGRWGVCLPVLLAVGLLQGIDFSKRWVLAVTLAAIVAAVVINLPLYHLHPPCSVTAKTIIIIIITAIIAAVIIHETSFAETFPRRKK